MDQPVLVAGAGPVGMTMAMASKRRGVDVRIVDKSAARTDKSKALVVWPRTLELLAIQGCVEPFLAAGIKGTGAHLRWRQGARARHSGYRAQRLSLRRDDSAE